VRNSPLVGNGGVAKWGMTGRTVEPLLQNLTSHPNVDLLYKSQLFTDCFNGKWRVGPLKWGIGEKRLRTPVLEQRHV